MSAISSRCDVVVIGAGPAGCVAAGVLAKEGIAVTLLEKAKYPRPNVGESLIPHFWKYADLIGATKAIEAEGFIRKGGGLAMWGGVMRQLRLSDFGHKRAPLHVERDVFDNILLGAARDRGTTAHEGVTVLSVDPYGDPATVRYRTADGEEGTIAARYVVDASGQGAVVSRQLGIRQFDPHLRFMSLWGYYVGGRYMTIDGEVRPFEDRRVAPPATVTATLGNWGWVWHIVMRDSVSIGVILPLDRMKELKLAGEASTEERFQRIVANSPIVGRLMEGAEFLGTVHAIKDYAYMPTQLAVGRCYLTGDAAAFVDPINTAGVVFAMYSGFLSATSISGSLHNAADEERFRNMYSKLYGDRLSLFRILALPADSPGIADAVEKAAAAVASLSQQEQALMLGQATLTSRPNGIAAALLKRGIAPSLDIRTIELPPELAASLDQVS